jgi:cytidylate kinase
LIITVDGPASSGKGTIAKALAKKLGYVYLDTGAMYRALTYYCLSKKIDVFDEGAVEDALMAVDLTFDRDFSIYLNGEDVSEKIRTDEISALTSVPVSTYARVREGIVAKERAIAEAVPHIIIDGRDSGTVVFPHADLKLFISASLDERALRRARQNKAFSQTTDVSQIANELAARDLDDIRRTISPLRIAQGGIIVDTTKLDVSETLELVYNITRAQNGS